MHTPQAPVREPGAEPLNSARGFLQKPGALNPQGGGSAEDGHHPGVQIRGQAATQGQEQQQLSQRRHCRAGGHGDGRNGVGPGPAAHQLHTLKEGALALYAAPHLQTGSGALS